MAIGSTTTLGSGAYQFGLPVPASSSDQVVVTGMETSPNEPLIGRGAAASTVWMYLSDGSSTAAINSASSGLASGSVLRISGTYEAA